MVEKVQVKILAVCQVSPPPSTNNVPPTIVPMTFFDIPWLLFGASPVEHLFFYQYSHSTSHFLQSSFPTLRHSLSLALQQFFPLASKLVCPPPPNKPHFLCTPNDSLSLTIAESTADFNNLLSLHQSQDLSILRPLVPPLEGAPMGHIPGDLACPLVAIQLTVFPYSGVAIALKFRHVACDGRMFLNFVRSWATLSRNGGDPTGVELESPYFERDIIKDPNGLVPLSLKQWWGWASQMQEINSQSPPPIQNPSPPLMGNTFVISKQQIDKLKSWVSKQCNDNETSHLSTFVVASAFMWTCWAKAKEADNNGAAGGLENKLYSFHFFADCRNRLDLGGSVIPSTYYGNCVILCCVQLEKNVLVGQYGFWSAAEAIGDKVMDVKNNGVLREVERLLHGWADLFTPGNVLTVVGSPLLRFYDTDFGWGRPLKTTFPYLDSWRVILSENRDEKGGIEFGLALSQPSMEAFASLFEQGLKLL